ncbi:MAG TPA: DNA polymerase I [Thermoanaerobaculia bacterium]|nr:DNA polymerase I [Thermoanaerobaculia bacterium]
MTSRGRLFLVDGSNNLYRSYYAIRGLTTSSGMATNAVYGFIQMLRKLIKDHQPAALAVAFDVKAPTFRHQQFEDYKKDRKPMPDDLSVQVPLVREAVEGLGIPILELPEYEADDVIGSLACHAREAGWDVVIATSDKDFFQLVGEGISLYHTGREVLYDPSGVEEAFGLPPEKVVDVMALWGDAIDNIPGVPGIGEKSAKALIQQFGSIDELYTRIDEVKKPAQKKALLENRDKALLSRDLVSIRCELPLTIDLDTLVMKEPDRGKLHDLFSRLEFHSLLQEYLPAEASAPRDFRTIASVSELDRFLAGVGSEPLALYCEPNATGRAIESVTIASEPSRAMILPIINRLGASDQLADAARNLLSSDRLFLAHDMKAELRKLEAAGWPQPARYHDTMIASYVLQPGAYGHSLEILAREKLRREIITRKEFIKSVTTLFAMSGSDEQRSQIDSPACEYLGEKAEMAVCLWRELGPQLEQEAALERIYREVELPLIPVLARMESHGIRVDTDLLASMSATMGEQLARLESQIYAAAGEEFNINSPQQLATILFEKLQYPALKKTQKTKSASTGVEVLKELASYGYEVPKLILEQRELHKLKGTYVDALPALVAEDGRVHTTFNQAVAATGRLSSSDPNLQNIPIRTEAGRLIRRAFIADPGWVLLAADYSQIELRVLAHMTEDRDLIDAFKRGVDIHRATAARIFNRPEPEVTLEQRRASKTINFGVLYGMSAFRLAHELNISQTESKEFIESYFARYPTIRQYLERTLEEARSTGKVTTLFGRVRGIPEIQNRSWTVRGNAERMATNAPIQGTAADLLKMAMIRLDEVLAESGSQARMLLTVHDEIVLEVPEDDITTIEPLVRSTMEGIYPLAVPLAVETHWGRTWYEAKES